MQDNFLKSEDTLTNLITELTRIKNSNDHIAELEKLAGKLAKIGDETTKTSIQLTGKAQSILEILEKAQIEEKLKSITTQLAENKKTSSLNTAFLFIVLIIQAILLYLHFAN